MRGFLFFIRNTKDNTQTRFLIYGCSHEEAWLKVSNTLFAGKHHIIEEVLSFKVDNVFQYNTPSGSP